MACFVLRGSIPNKICKVLLLASCVAFCAWIQTPLASAQRVGGGHVGGHASGGGRIVAPSSRPTVARPHGSPGRPLAVTGAGLGHRSFRVPMRPIFGRRRSVFVGAPFFGFAGFPYNSFWWSPCGYLGGWDFGCNSLTVPGTGFENYVTVPSYVNPPELYGELEPQQVWLYLKDGTVYSVDDYWFVNGSVHFTVADEPGANPLEQVIGFDELDVQRTIDVNTARGFRLVMRDLPWRQYAHDHPDLIPPPLTPPPPVPRPAPPQNK